MDEAQSRPSEMCAAFEVCDSHGWPSISSSPRSSSPPTSHSSTSSTAPDASSPGSRHLNAAFLTLCSHVYLGYHTVALVIASATLGMVLGAGWFWIVNTILVYYFPAIEESGIGRFLYIKEEIDQRLKSNLCY